MKLWHTTCVIIDIVIGHEITRVTKAPNGLRLAAPPNLPRNHALVQMSWPVPQMFWTVAHSYKHLLERLGTHTVYMQMCNPHQSSGLQHLNQALATTSRIQYPAKALRSASTVAAFGVSQASSVRHESVNDQDFCATRVLLVWEASSCMISRREKAVLNTPHPAPHPGGLLQQVLLKKAALFWSLALPILNPFPLKTALNSNGESSLEVDMENQTCKCNPNESSLQLTSSNLAVACRRAAVLTCDAY